MNTPTPRLAVRVAGWATIAVLPLFLLALLELLLGLVFFIYPTPLLETYQQTRQRSGYQPELLDTPNHILADLRSPGQKIAIFGGSSAAGFAAAQGFNRQLAALAPSGTVVHTYAQPGAPFAGYQANLARIAAPFYDVVIIYAGHNEVWQHLYQDALQKGGVVTFPNGETHDPRPGLAAQQRAEAKLTQVLSMLETPNAAWPTSAKERVRFIVDRLRLANLARQTIVAVKAAAANKPSIANPGYPFLAAEPLVSAPAREQFATTYQAALEPILAALRPSQTLIISTLMANDLYPPVLGSFKGTEAERAQANVELARLYAKLASQQPPTAAELASLPPSAHTLYLKAIRCLKGPLGTGPLPQQCLRPLQQVRRADDFLYRVVPALNAFVRSLKGRAPNVQVIDAEALLHQRATTQAAYLNAFVDFQHPSTAGHTLVTELIGQQLWPARPMHFQTDACERVRVNDGATPRTLVPTPAQLQNAFAANREWLHKMLSLSPTPLLHQHYLDANRAAAARCLPTSR